MQRLGANRAVLLQNYVGVTWEDIHTYVYIYICIYLCIYTIRFRALWGEGEGDASSAGLALRQASASLRLGHGCCVLLKT